MMGTTLGLTAGFVFPKIPNKIVKYKGNRSHLGDYRVSQLVCDKVHGSNPRCFLQGRCISRSMGGNHFGFRSSNHLSKEPFWLSLINEAFGAVKSLFNFLHEQPSQLKHIEWPSFQSTLKTATLTLVLVAVLIVALASVDSALCFLLNLLLRKAP